MRFRGSLQDIRLFVASYEERSFTAAATRENVTQSGISHHIRQLENSLGVKLFVREKFGVCATPAADLFYRHCVGILREIDASAGQISDLAAGEQGQLTIGMTPVLTHRLAAPTLLRFAEQNPNVKVRVVETLGDTLRQMILSGEIDIAFAPPLSGGGLRVQRLFSAPECLIAGAGSPRSADAVNLVLPVLRERRHAAITAALKHRGVTVSAELHIDSALAILDLLGRSNWQTVAPCFILDPEADEARYRVQALLDPELTLSIYLIQPATRVMPRSAEIFAELLSEEAAKVVDFWTSQSEGHTAAKSGLNRAGFVGGSNS